MSRFVIFSEGQGQWICNPISVQFRSWTQPAKTIAPGKRGRLHTSLPARWPTLRVEPILTARLAALGLVNPENFDGPSLAGIDARVAFPQCSLPVRLIGDAAPACAPV